LEAPVVAVVAAAAVPAAGGADRSIEENYDIQTTSL
jgi:hypothetical protein